jgi:hypothetical protein
MINTPTHQHQLSTPTYTSIHINVDTTIRQHNNPTLLSATHQHNNTTIYQLTHQSSTREHINTVINTVINTPQSSIQQYSHQHRSTHINTINQSTQSSTYRQHTHLTVHRGITASLHPNHQHTNTNYKRINTSTQSSTQSQSSTHQHSHFINTINVIHTVINTSQHNYQPTHHLTAASQHHITRH